jgi:hypothetical protein
VRLGAGLFDTRDAGAAIARLIDRRIRENFPQSHAMGLVRLPRVRRTTTALALRPGVIRIAVAGVLEDDTRFAVSFDARPESRGGELVVRRVSRVETHYEVGPAWQRAILGIPLLGPAVIRPIANGRVTEEVTSHVDDALAEFRLPDAFAPFSDRPGDRVRLRLGGDPEIAPTGIVLPLCATVVLAAPRVDPEVPGPPRVPFAPPDLAATGDPGATVSVAVTPALLNQVLYVLWQTGRLRAWGRAPAIRATLPTQVRTLAFEFAGLEPRLPPVIAGDADGTDPRWRVALGDVALGRFEGQTVVAHGEMFVRVVDLRPGSGPVGSAGAIALAGDLGEPRINCVRATAPDVWRYSPCLSDVLPVVRERRDEYRPSWTLDAGLIARLTHFEFHGLRLALSDLRVSMAAGRGPQLRVSSRGMLALP